MEELALGADEQEVEVINARDKPSKRNAHGMELIGDYLLVVGGAGSYCNQINIFDIRAREWHEPVPLPHLGYGVGSAVVDGDFYFFGGTSSEGRIMRKFNRRTKPIRFTLCVTRELQEVGRPGPDGVFYHGMVGAESCIDA
eukprot:TRINITY_DN1107_c0_g3_i2.p1 TRINITY_DN1107_c0_g3~~TRINITY_DN1107_c0_g3_i2.p1  ORF type:complete len:141 (+),score=18.84 TRINITY_DN1107_c0_g3_i2:508-930(+)